MTLPTASYFIGEQTRTEDLVRTQTHPPTDTHTHKDSISRLNELFKTGGLFPDPWLCKSHCCQPIKQVQGPHSLESGPQKQSGQNRTSWLPFRVRTPKEVSNTSATKQTPLLLTRPRMFDARGSPAPFNCDRRNYFNESIKAAEQKQSTIWTNWRSGLVCGGQRRHKKEVASWQNSTEMFWIKLTESLQRTLLE